MLDINRIYQGDCLDLIKSIDNNSIDAVITDPPYELGFMGKSWDSTGIANNIEVWQQAYRVLKPGGYLLSFGGTRTYHRMACAIEDAGFEIRDMIEWIYGSGFPKSLDISKAIDKMAGAEREIVGNRSGAMNNADNSQARSFTKGDVGYKTHFNITTPTTPSAIQWEGWGTALKPAHEPICMARKPLECKTVAENVLKYGTGGINIYECRIKTEEQITNHSRSSESAISKGKYGDSKEQKTHQTDGQIQGRFPANLIHDGSDEVMAEFEKYGNTGAHGGNDCGYDWANGGNKHKRIKKDSGTPARFFYCAKASKSERGESNNHCTVKPIKLMEYLIKLVTTEKAIVLDPFAGSGSTLIACRNLGRQFIGIEKETDYVEIANKRIEDFTRQLVLV